MNAVITNEDINEDTSKKTVEKSKKQEHTKKLSARAKLMIQEENCERNNTYK